MNSFNHIKSLNSQESDLSRILQNPRQDNESVQDHDFSNDSQSVASTITNSTSGPMKLPTQLPAQSRSGPNKNPFFSANNALPKKRASFELSQTILPHDLRLKEAPQSKAPNKTNNPDISSMKRPQLSKAESA